VEICQGLGTGTHPTGQVISIQLVQELTRSAGAEEESAFYYAFIIGRRYVSILADGPKANQAELGQTASKLRILPPPAR
jgi:hypothetical protein